METPKKDKVKHRFTPAEAADYLRQLADALEQGHIALRSEELDLEGEVKVKEEFKAKADKATLKINLKLVSPIPIPAPGETTPGEDGEAQAAAGFVEISDQPQEPAEPEGKVSFKKIKKAMGKSFGQLKDARKQGAMPQAEEVAAFLADARAMCTFDQDKYGREQFPPFLAALEGLEAALAANDPQALDLALAAIGERKSECHGKFK